jgi:DNA-binding CsgD family transcriptional regulator
LVAWGAVGFDAERPHVPVALNPLEAAQRNVKQEIEEAERRVARLKSLPDLADQLAVHYERAQWRAGGGSEFLDDSATVNARLDDVVASAHSEILAAQPGGPRDRALLERAVARDTDALARGVTLRTLYRDTVRDHQVTAEGARIMSARGAAYRTLVAPFERCIVVDRRYAFISDHVVEGSPPHAAWYVTDRAMVAFVAVVFDEAWRRASPWHGELRSRRALEAVDTLSGPDTGVRTNRRQREILRDMAAGTPQTVTARRLGISRRTLTDQITALKSLFGAQTLHELTYQFALSPDHRVDDSAAAAEPVAGETAA